MPAGAAFAPGAFPKGFAGLGGLPQGEIKGVFLFLAGGHARAGEQLVEAAAGKLAVRLVGPHAKIHIARRGGVGLARFDEPRAQSLDLRNKIGGSGFFVRAQHAKAVHVFMEGVNISLGNLAPVAAFLVGAVDDFVVHVGEVAYKTHLKAHVAQVA